MKGKFLKRAAAMSLALAMMTGVMPFKPVSDIFDMSVNTYAANTVTGSIPVGGKIYNLYSGFTASDGTAGVGVHNYPNLVDNNTSTMWYTSSLPTYIIFKADKAIVPTGYIINTNSETNFKPKSWKLYANQTETENTDDEGWILLDTKTDVSFDGTEGTFYCDTTGKYSCFKLEFTGSSTKNGLLKTTEFRFFGYDDYTYTPVFKRPATCVRR